MTERPAQAHTTWRPDPADLRDRNTGRDPSAWYWNSRRREPARQATRVDELTAQGADRSRAWATARAEAGQREWEREERAASRDPARYYGPDSPETRMTFRERAMQARQVISAARERHQARETRTQRPGRAGR